MIRSGQMPQQQANIPINPVTGHPYNPARAGDRWFFGLNPDGTPKTQQQRALEAQMPAGPNGTRVGHVDRNGNYVPSVDPDGGFIDKNGNYVSGPDVNLNDDYNRWALNGAQGQPPNAGKYRVPPNATPRQQLQATVANTLAGMGASPNFIAGVFANIPDESSWNPTSSHYDQPGYSRYNEAAYSHGLLQEGGPDWPAFQQFLNGRDWRNPQLQMEFMMHHFRQNYPQAFARMNAAQSPRIAAQIFVQQYLRPSYENMIRRSGKYSRGVPGMEAYRLAG
jgi:hypothetical protein